MPKGVIPPFDRDGAGMTPDEITALARSWIFWDWLRMAMIAAAFFALLRALTMTSADEAR